jgi:Uma2 family endonuclease
MLTQRHWTIDDLEHLELVEGERYEIIDGELCVSTQPDYVHQQVCTYFWLILHEWGESTGAGEPTVAPGVIFAPDNAVAPDVIWISRDRLAHALDSAGHLRVPPELVIEVLSPGSANVRREREKKLAVYGRFGVDEYWIANWRSRTIMVYRRQGPTLELATTLTNSDVLTSPRLPGFSQPVSVVFRSARDQRSSP